MFISEMILVLDINVNFKDYESLFGHCSHVYVCADNL